MKGEDLLNRLVHDIYEETEVDGDDLSAFCRVGSDGGNDSDFI